MFDCPELDIFYYLKPDNYYHHASDI